MPKWYAYDLQFNYVFLTVPGCLLALLGLAETVRRRNFFWLVFTLLCVDLSFGRYGYLAPFAYQVPFVNLFRNMATFFDLANLSLCLMAAVGAGALFQGALSRMLRKYLPYALFSLLGSTALLGLALSLAAKIHGWYHMLSILAVASLIVTAMLRKKLLPSIAQWALLGIMIFELFFYNMNQRFNGFPMIIRKRSSAETLLWGKVEPSKYCVRIRTQTFESRPLQNINGAAMAGTYGRFPGSLVGTQSPCAGTKRISGDLQTPLIIHCRMEDRIIIWTRLCWICLVRNT